MHDLLLTIPARAIGLFYAVAGVILLRRLPTDVVMDRMLAALGDASAAAERQRTRLWMLGGALVFASGLALAALSSWAPVLFVAASLLQVGYLLWVTAALPPEAEEERRGRQSVVQAAVLYLLATGFVLWLDRRGVWRVWLEPPALELLVLLAITAAVAGLLLRGALGTVPNLPFAVPPRQGPPILQLRPTFGSSPLRDGTGAPVDPADLGLDEALRARIAAWDATFQRSVDAADPSIRVFADLASEQAWFDEGLAIAAAIQLEWTDTLINGVSALGGMIAAGRTAPELGPRCGVAEIHEIIQRLDSLAEEKAALPDQDSDSRDDVAREQAFLAHLLAHARDRYGPEIRRGLDSPAAETRRWVALALGMRGATGAPRD